MTYEAAPEFNSDIQIMLDSNDSNVVVKALLSTVMNGDHYDLAVSSTRRFLLHQDKYVRGTAIECISHIGRLWNKVPFDFLSQVSLALNDSDEWVRGKAEYTIGDLEVFIKGYKRPKAD